MLQIFTTGCQRLVISVTLILFPLLSSNYQHISTEVISGTILGWTCEHGLIIEVDRKYPIGKRLNIYRDYLPDQFAIKGKNIIAAVNETRFSDKKGEKIYFRYHPADSIKQRVCSGWQSDTLQLAYVDINIIDRSNKN